MASDSCFDDDVADVKVSPLTAVEARALRIRLRTTSVWHVIGVQLLVAIGATGVAAVLFGVDIARSVACGGCAAVLPAALFALGVLGQCSPSVAVFRFLVYEFVKIAATVAVLYLSHRWVAQLNWPAMMVGLIVTLKVHWLFLAAKLVSFRAVPC